MQIAIIGYGKMGKAVEKVALKRGHQVAWIANDPEELQQILNEPHGASVAIEFTLPDQAPGNISACIKANLPIVSGTTGWNDQLETIQKKCLDQSGSFLHASNFSLGMNIFFYINEILAAKLNDTGAYKPSLKETHHIHKMDHPSGTAITLAEKIIANYDSIHNWEETRDEVENNILQIESFREGEVPGTHEINWNADFDEIKLVHTAKNRNGFALGAVLAAEYISGRKGIFTMSDVLNL